MGFLSSRRERKYDEYIRSGYPDEWVMGERLANFQFRDFIYCGSRSYSSEEQEQLAEATASEAEHRFLEMRGIIRSRAHPGEMQAFNRAYRRRLVHLLKEHARTPPPESDDAFFVGVAGVLNRGSAAALIMEAEKARWEDDMSGGPLTTRSMRAEWALNEIHEKDVPDATPDEELARSFPDQMADILQRDVFIGMIDLEDAIAVLPSARSDLAEAAAAREARLRGGPLVPHR